MLKAVYGINLSTNVELLSSVVKILHSWVVLISAEYLLCLDLPVYELEYDVQKGRVCPLVRLVDIVHGDNGKISIITEIAQCVSSRWLNAQLFDCFFRQIEGDWHREKVSICETVFGNDTGNNVSIWSKSFV